MILEIHNLTMSFSGLVAIKDLSLSIPQGKITSLIGPNGAGKTTVFNCITKLYEWTHGDVQFQGKSLQNNQTHHLAHMGIARTFQNIRLFPDLTVEDNVLIGQHSQLTTGVFGALCRPPATRKEEQRARSRARDYLTFVNLSHRIQDLAKNLPYGEQRRLEIGRALAAQPTLLLLDEPAAGMNPQETADLITLIQNIRAQGTTILLIEHDMKLVMGISDHIAVMNFGVKIAEGTPHTIQKNPEVIEAYLGSTHDAQH